MIGKCNDPDEKQEEERDQSKLFPPITSAIGRHSTTGLLAGLPQQLLVFLDDLGLLAHHLLDLRAREQLEIFAGLLHLLPQHLVFERLGECARQHRDAILRHLLRGHGVPDLVDGRDTKAQFRERRHVGQRLLALLAGDGEKMQALAHARARSRSADRRVDVAAHDRRIGFARALEMHHSERQVQFLLQRRELDVARSRTPDGADYHATLVALVDELLEGLNRRILLHAELPAHHAPSEDRDELARLVARPPDDLVDRPAGRGLRHHHVAIRPRGVELGAGDAPARSQDVVEAGLDPLLLEVGLDDPRGRVDRSTRRLVDDPADVAGGELLLRPGRGTQWRDATRCGAERGAGGVAQETAPVDLRLAAHVVLLSPVRASEVTPRALGSHVPRPLSSAFRYKKCASAMSCETRPVVWIKIRSSSRSRPFFLPDTRSWISPWSCARENWPDSIIRLNSPCSMLKSQLSMTTLSSFDQPAGSSSRRASEMKVAPGLSQGSRLTTSLEVVPPTAISAPRTTSSIVSLGTTAIPSACDHFRANAARVSGRRDVQRISSNLYMVQRQRSEFVAIVPTPTRPRIFGCLGPIHLQARVAAAALRMA